MAVYVVYFLSDNNNQWWLLRRVLQRVPVLIWNFSNRKVTRSGWWSLVIQKLRLKPTSFFLINLVCYVKNSFYGVLIVRGSTGLKKYIFIKCRYKFWPTNKTIFPSKNDFLWFGGKQSALNIRYKSPMIDTRLETVSVNSKKKRKKVPTNNQLEIPLAGPGNDGKVVRDGKWKIPAWRRKKF